MGSIILTLTSCAGGGGGSSGVSGGDFNNDDTSSGNSGTESQKYPSKWHDFPINENKFTDRQFGAIGSREGEGNIANAVVLTQDASGNITQIKLYDPYDSWGDNDLSGTDWEYGTQYVLTPDGGKFKTSEIYDYSVPFLCDVPWFDGMDIIHITSDKKLSFQEMKTKLTEYVNTKYKDNTDNKKKALAAIESLKEGNFGDKEMYDDYGYTSQDIGKYFVSPRQMTMDITAYGKSLGLEFANFGKLSGVYKIGDINMNKVYLFAGGVPENKIEKSQLNGKMHFDGRAVGVVRNYISSPSGVMQNYMDIESDAKLTFDNGREELFMNFSENADPAKRWYDVKMFSDGTGKDVSYELTNEDRIAEQNAEYKMDKKSWSPADTSGQNGDSGTWFSSHLDTQYYGESGNPSEAVGTVGIWQSEYNETQYNHEKEFMATFGATRTE